MKGWTTDSIKNLSSSRGQEGDKPVRRKKKEEERIQVVFADYMRLKYPRIIFRSDFAAGIKMSMGQAILHKRMQHSRAYPDIFISKSAGGYHGLYLELKKDRSEVYKKDGTYVKNAHIQEQVFIMQRLSDAGYYCRFACGIDEAMSITEKYLNDEI